MLSIVVDVTTTVTKNIYTFLLHNIRISGCDRKSKDVSNVENTRDVIRPKQI